MEVRELRQASVRMLTSSSAWVMISRCGDGVDEAVHRDRHEEKGTAGGPILFLADPLMAAIGRSTARYQQSIHPRHTCRQWMAEFVEDNYIRVLPGHPRHATIPEGEFHIMTRPAFVGHLKLHRHRWSRPTALRHDSTGFVKKHS